MAVLHKDHCNFCLLIQETGKAIYANIYNESRTSFVLEKKNKTKNTQTNTDIYFSLPAIIAQQNLSRNYKQNSEKYGEKRVQAAKRRDNRG